MRKVWLISILLSTFCLNTEAQNKQSIVRDSLLLDSLKQALPASKDSTRIEFLNQIADAFLNRDGYDIKRKADSASVYANYANREARNIHYKTGLAYSLIDLAHASSFYYFYNRSHKIDNAGNFNSWEKYLTELFSLAPEVNNASISALAYYWQADYLRKKTDIKGSLAALKNALKWFENTGDSQRISEVCTYICSTYSETGEFDKGFDFCKRALSIAKNLEAGAGPKVLNNALLQIDLVEMAELYKAAGDYDAALSFLRESRLFHEQHNASNTWGMEGELGDIFLLQHNLDSAYYYIQPLAHSPYVGLASFQWPKMGDIFLLKGNYDSALVYYNKTVDTLKSRSMIEGPKTALMRSFYGKAKLSERNSDYLAALEDSRTSLAYARDVRNVEYILNNLDLLSELFHQRARNDSAYFYSRKYIELKDSVLSRQFYFRLNSYKRASEDDKRVGQIKLLNKENQLKESKLKQQASLRNSLAMGMLLLIIAGTFLFRSFHLKRKNEVLLRQQLESELKIQQLQSVELEMQALRAQMNPHFIFNCLSSINSFILKHEAKTASNYLARFSRLMRMVLQNSQKKFIALEDELQMLRLYLEMERLRFKNSFDYTITILNEIDIDNIFIPPLILQPFCENAIWHGLMHKTDRGLLSIDLRMEEGVLNCTITDNGVGREEAEALNSKTAEKKKSLGLQITKDRLALLNRNKQIALYEIEDMKDGNGIALGTRVTIRISIETLTGKPVSISQE